MVSAGCPSAGERDVDRLTGGSFDDDPRGACHGRAPDLREYILETEECSVWSCRENPPDGVGRVGDSAGDEVGDVLCRQSFCISRFARLVRWSCRCAGCRCLRPWGLPQCPHQR